MRVTQKMLVDTVRLNINHNVESLNSLQDQLASGKRLRRASDDPAALSRALSLRSQKSENEQYQRNITSARGWLEASDSSLDHLSDVLSRARSLAVRGATDSLGSDERSKLSEQVDALLNETEQVGNTTHEGKYLFSGRKVSTAPFDSAADPIYQGDTGHLSREIDNGVSFAVNTLSSEVTVSVTNSAGVTSSHGVIEGALTVLNAMKSQLASGGAVTMTQLDQVTQCLDGVVELRGAVGAKMTRLDVTQTEITANQTNATTALSRVEDADMAEVMTKLMMQQSVYQAALSAGSRVIQPSLLDFLS